MRAQDNIEAPISVAKNVNSRLYSSPFTAPAYRIIRAQLIATVLVTALCLLIDGVAAYSALLGGLTCVIPAAFMLKRLEHPGSEAGSATVALTMAVAGKLVLTCTLFIAVFLLVKPLDARWFFGVLIGLHGLYVIVPLAGKRT